MKIICSTSMPFVKEAFSTLGEAVVIEGRAISHDDVRDADLMAIRSTTRVDRRLLEGSPVKFVGTATIGIDHMDTAYMESADIHWCYSPGCNANSVSEYVTAALLCLARRHGFKLEGKTLGVVGVGNVGKLVVQKGLALGMRVLQNDPPRQRTEGKSSKTEFVSLDRILAECDVVTLHVPLTKEGPDATLGMANETFFKKMKPGCIFLNCARGGAVKTDALLRALDNKTVSHVILDTWEGEPAYREDMLARADIATPHIAGHSFEGKVMGTVMVYREACRFLGRKADWSHEPLMPPTLVPEVSLDTNGRDEENVLWELVKRIYDIESDDRRMRKEVKSDERAAHFDKLRKDYPMRREFRFTRVILKNASPALEHKIRALGFA